MKVKLKLSYDEANVVLTALKALCDEYRSKLNELSMEDKLLMAVLEEMMISIWKIGIIKKEQYTISLKPAWAFAFYITTFGQISFYSYEGRAIQKICDQIHQSFS